LIGKGTVLRLRSGQASVAPLRSTVEERRFSAAKTFGWRSAFSAAIRHIYMEWALAPAVLTPENHAPPLEAI